VPNKSDIARLHRLALIRDAYTRVAEVRVKETEGQVREIERQDEEIVRNIQVAQAEFAERPVVLGREIQRNDNYVNALLRHRKVVRQSLEKARVTLDQRREVWVETRREQKIVDRLEARRLQLWQHEQEIALQKFVNDAFIGRLVRSRLQE
jgi:flagellar export protein FliJ